MVTKPTDSSTKPKKSRGEQSGEGHGNLVYKINQLKKQIQMERIVYIKKKFEENEKKVENHVQDLLMSATRNDRLPSLFSSKIEKPLIKFEMLSQGFSGDKDSIYEIPSSMSIKLPYIERLPPYTTWIFLDRNQRMAEDQSVVGRRRIYYDQHGSEALICSDSEEEVAEHEEEQYDYSKAEDRIIWMAFEEHGCSDDTANILSQFVGGTVAEIQDRYKVLKEKHHKKQSPHFKSGSDWDILLAKTLGAALDSFDNLFCRRCLLFDCRLHGCSQSLIYPSEKQSHTLEVEDDGKPCSDHCYLQLKSVRKSGEESALSAFTKSTRKSSNGRKESLASSDAEELTTDADDTQKQKEITSAVKPTSSTTDADNTVYVSRADTDTFQDQSLGKRKVSEARDTLLPVVDLVPDDVQVCPAEKQKKLKTAQSGEEEMITGVSLNELHGHTSKEIGCSDSTSSDKIEEVETERVRHISEEPDMMQASDTAEKKEAGRDSTKALTEPRQAVIWSSKNSITEPKLSSSNQVEGRITGGSSASEWRPIEKELYLKGVEIFGRNSCLIARNMLSGLKTCIEVSRYMRDGRASVPSRSAAAPSLSLDDNEKADMDSPEREMPVRTRLLRRRGRTRKLKYSWKSGGHPSIWKRIADGKNQSCKQYIPCGCQLMCGKQCPCLENGTCCEKYCGCSKSCKNRFRGCHCAKSQCRSRQCPCFAAGRECDPDVCRNCWVSCGDGSLSEPPRRGDGQCGNMRLLLRQQQRILLAKSDVAGWGAFLKNAVNKNDYLGEYTGELISHREADKRGKIYDRANSSFLFDLNDQFVLDAFRKGDKLKFANHSSNPNCYAKVMLVAGDHRVGIFAKDRIEASEELFYDYRYGPDQAPAWARKPEGSKRDDLSISLGRAKKHQSH